MDYLNNPGLRRSSLHVNLKFAEAFMAIPENFQNLVAVLVSLQRSHSHVLVSL